MLTHQRGTSDPKAAGDEPSKLDGYTDRFKFRFKNRLRRLNRISCLFLGIAFVCPLR